MNPKTAPYGSWKSPITSELITSESVTLDQVQVDSGAIYWIERRPGEQGRCTIVCHEEQFSDSFQQEKIARFIEIVITAAYTQYMIFQRLIDCFDVPYKAGGFFRVEQKC